MRTFAPQTKKLWLVQRTTLFYGVMVAQQILVLFVQVRILVEQRKASLKKEAFFMFAGIHNLLTFVK